MHEHAGAGEFGGDDPAVAPVVPWTAADEGTAAPCRCEAVEDDARRACTGATHQLERWDPRGDRCGVSSGSLIGCHDAGRHGAGRDWGSAMRLLVRLTDGTAEADLSVINADVEAALGIAAHPGLVGNRRTIASVIAEREKYALFALLAMREIHGLCHCASKREEGTHRCSRCVVRPSERRSTDTPARTPDRTRTRRQSRGANR